MAADSRWQYRNLYFGREVGTRLVYGYGSGVDERSAGQGAQTMRVQRGFPKEISTFTPASAALISHFLYHPSTSSAWRWVSEYFNIIDVTNETPAFPVMVRSASSTSPTFHQCFMILRWAYVYLYHDFAKATVTSSYCYVLV